MSYKDRGSPILLESGLKSFLGHPGHNFPLINATLSPGSFEVETFVSYYKQSSVNRTKFYSGSTIAAHNWPRDSYGYISMSSTEKDSTNREQYYDEGPSASSPYHVWAHTAQRQWVPHYYDSPQFQRRFSANTGNSKPTHPHSHGHSTIKDIAGSILGDDKKDDGELWNTVEAQTAFLGPNLWDKTYETDLKYVDLDEFLSENGVSMDGLGSHGSLGALPTSQTLPKRERSPSPSDCMSPDTMNPPSPADSTLSMASSCRDFDPRKRAFSDEELKPQPLIKKSRKQFVPDDLKDDKYWARRRKNNLAAKRSRDARRMKENQIALRAGYLEKENVGLRQELERLKKENLILQNKLAKYEDV